MSLRESVLRFTEAAFASPAFPTVARLDGLARSALDPLAEGFESRTLHRAPDTWQIAALLRHDQLQTGRLVFQFPWAVEIVAMRPSVEPVAVGGEPSGTVPFLDNLDVQIDINQEDYITNSSGLTTVNGFGAAPTVPIRDDHFVSLGSIDVRERAFGLYLPSSQAVLGMTFRWTQPITNGSDFVFRDCIIKVALDSCRIGDKEVLRRQALIERPRIWQGAR